MAKKPTSDKDKFADEQAITRVEIPIDYISDDLEVIEPMFAVVREIGVEGDNFVARFPDANMNASGDTTTEAIENLREIISAAFRRLSSLPAAKLGLEPTRQLNVLKKFVARCAPNGTAGHKRIS